MSKFKILHNYVRIIKTYFTCGLILIGLLSACKEEDMTLGEGSVRLNVKVSTTNKKHLFLCIFLYLLTYSSKINLVNKIHKSNSINVYPVKH